MNPQQLAAEAAQTIETNDGNLAYKTAVIQTAIEKATAIVVAEMKELNEASDYEYEKQLDRAAQASEEPIATDSVEISIKQDGASWLTDP